MGSERDAHVQSMGGARGDERMDEETEEGAKERSQAGRGGGVRQVRAERRRDRVTEERDGRKWGKR